MISGTAIFATGFAVSFVGATLIVRSRRLRRFSIIRPAEDRWHLQATPGLGGIPMFAAFVLVAWLVGAESDAHTTPIMAGAFILFIIGFIDDLFGLSAGLKLLAQMLAACVVVFSGFPDNPASATFWHHPLLAVFWIVVMANGINLLDNMDGLAGGVALIAVLATVLVLPESVSELHVVRGMLTGLAGALAGFLVLNINPARLFMGDSGSQWLGLVVGASSLLTVTTATDDVMATSSWAWLVPPLIVALPIIDTSFVIITRMQRSQAVTQGGRDHLSHRLVSLGFTERTSVAALWFLSISGVVVAHVIIRAEPVIWAPMLMIFIMAVGLLIRYVLRVALPATNNS